MSMREDLDSMEQHQRNGTLKEFFAGTAPMLDQDGYVIANPVFNDAGEVVGYKRTPIKRRP